MASFKFKNMGKSSLKETRKVYFTCHPEDFKRYFDKICGDIFKCQSCMVYYTENMESPLSNAEREDNIGLASLVVVPVTRKLLTEKNRAMEDIAFAKSKSIPVLPFMMEKGLDVLYSAADKFGTMQYINPFSNDVTEISYEEKLRKYLGTVLISDELVNKIRGAFDAYIFLSYRKKDRAHANELMRLIHANPEFRDIAIWYDEFLTPGESFKENIDRILADSRLFTLLVTPSVLEEPNFVMANEYPAAKKAGMPIVPAEMVSTDHLVLSAKYAEIPETLNPSDNKKLVERLSGVLTRLAKTENDSDPMHNYLIGLAYFEGIDVEVDTERGLKLMESASAAGLIEATRKLYELHHYRTYSEWGRERAKHYIVRLLDQCEKQYGKDDLKTTDLRMEICHFYEICGEYNMALAFAHFAYDERLKALGKAHPDTIEAMLAVAGGYSNIGDYKKALEIYEPAYYFLINTFGEADKNTIIAQNGYAVALSNTGNVQKATEINKRAYDARLRLFGEESETTLSALNNLAVNYSNLGQYEKARELLEKIYSIEKCQYGEEHYNSVTTLNNLASVYGSLGFKQKALELSEKAYKIICKVLGEQHPQALSGLHNLAFNCGQAGNHTKALELSERAYRAHEKVLGASHPDTIRALEHLVYECNETGDYGRALDFGKIAYPAYVKAFGIDNKYTITALVNLAVAYGRNGNYERMLACAERATKQRKRMLGENHADTVSAFALIGAAHTKLENHKDALSYQYAAYEKRKPLLGENNPYTRDSLACALLANEKLDDVRAEYENCKATFLYYAETYGLENSQALEALKKLAELCGQLGEYQMMLDFATSVMDNYKRLRGSDDYMTIDAIMLAATAQSRLGNHKAASDLYELAFNENAKAYGIEDEITILAWDRFETEQFYLEY